MGLFDYDNSSIDSILKYTAENLVGRSLYDLLEEYQNSEYKTYEDKKRALPQRLHARKLASYLRDSMAISSRNVSTALSPIILRNPTFLKHASRLKQPPIGSTRTVSFPPKNV